MPATAPLAASPSTKLFRAAHDLPTPSLLYDLEGLDLTVRRLQDDLSLLPNTRLNVALKATQNPAVLRWLARRGLGADAASIAEHRLARRSGFKEISATGPSLSNAEDIRELRQGGTLLDVTSIEQLDFFGRHFSGQEVGLRLRVPLPPNLDGPARFGANSRFGILATDPALASTLARHDLTVTRLHIHTGQLSPRSFLYVLEYLLTVASRLDSIDLLDLGGGFYEFYADRAVARACLVHAASLVREWTEQSGRSLRLRIEPGAALLGPHGFFVTTIQAIERRHAHFGVDVFQVDTSAWNFAPWHTPQVLHLDESRWNDATSPRLLVGNTLYENDFFGARHPGRLPTVEVPDAEVGDRLVITNAGAYTTANRRDFNLLGQLDEFMFDRNGLTACHGADVGVGVGVEDD